MKRIILGTIIIWMCFGFGCRKDTDFLITIQTEYGTMKAVLYDDTPIHKKNFIKLAKEGRFDSTTWHRVIKNFMIQAGDINAISNGKDSINYLLDAEFLPKYFHKRGAIGAARKPDFKNPDKKSSGSQFYIVQGKSFTEIELTTDMKKLGEQTGRLFMLPGYDSLKNLALELYRNRKFEEYNQLMLSLIPDINTRLGIDVSKTISQDRKDSYLSSGGAPWLDDEYTVFGQVVDGLHVIDSIANVKTNPRNNDRPLENIYLTISVEELSKSKIRKLYGVQYPKEEQ